MHNSYHVRAALSDEESNTAVVEAVLFIATAMKINTSVPHSLFARVEAALLKLPADVGMRLADQDYNSWETAVQSYKLTSSKCLARSQQQ